MKTTPVNTKQRVRVESKILDGDLGHVLDTGTIRIDPRQSERERLHTLVHEWLHVALPELPERDIRKLERSLGGMLWRQGYRRRKILKK